MTAPVDVLDLPEYVGQVDMAWRLVLVDGVTGAERGVAHPSPRSASLRHDSSATVSRTLSGITLDPTDAAWFRPLIDRGHLEALVDGRVFPLGRYVCVDDIEIVRSGGSDRPLTMVDETLIVDQAMETGFDAAGRTVQTAVAALLTDFTAVDPLIETSVHTSVSSWSAGTSRARVWCDLAVEGGYLKPWLDHDGTPRMIQACDPAPRMVAFALDAPPRAFADSITRESSLPDAPNRWIVVSNDVGADSDAAAGPVVGVWDVPGSAPHSIANRGFVIPEVVDRQVSTVVQATAMARSLGLAATVTETLEFDTPPDPRHDAYQVIRFLDELWWETGWTMPLSATGRMTHTATRAWPPMEDL